MRRALLLIIAAQLVACALVVSAAAGAAKSSHYASRSSDRFSLENEGDDFEFDLDTASKQKIKRVQQRFDGDDAIEVITNLNGESTIDYSTKIRPSGVNYGRGTRYVTTQAVLKGEVLFTVPFTDVISRESARQGRIKALMDANPDMATSILLAMHLLEERFLGDASRFYEYIATLPPTTASNSTMFYSEREMKQLQGSHLSRMSQARTKVVANYFDLLVGPVTSLAVDPPLFTATQFTKEQFQWAMGTVWARAFSLTPNESEAVIAPIFDTIGLCVDIDCPKNHIESDQRAQRIVVYASQDYAKGEEVLLSLEVPMPSTLLMLNYGFARRQPYSEVETLDISIFLDPSDPLVSIKTHVMEANNMSVNGSYVLRYKSDELDATLVRSLKMKLLSAPELDKYQPLLSDSAMVSLRNEYVFTRALVMTCRNLLAQYPTTLAHDKQQLERLRRDGVAGTVVHIVRALATEKEILQHTMDVALRMWTELLMMEDPSLFI